jgi:uncharacterized membrane protein YidH (DUF202 family)
MGNPEKLATYQEKQNQKHNTICVGHHYTQANTNNVNKTRTLLQTTGDRDVPNIYCIIGAVLVVASVFIFIMSFHLLL